MSEDKSCAMCTHGMMCLLRRYTAKANNKVNLMIIPNDLAKICFEYRKKLEKNT